MGVGKVIYYFFHPNEVKAMIQWFVSHPPWPCNISLTPSLQVHVA